MIRCLYYISTTHVMRVKDLDLRCEICYWYFTERLHIVVNKGKLSLLIAL